MTGTLKPGRNCWRIREVEQAGVLVDARNYYRAFHAAVLRARRYVLIAGWQFDSDVLLLRGEDARGVAGPHEFLPFLKAACAKNPELEIYILAWDYSIFYALEREWMQRLIFDWSTDERIHFQFDAQHATGASHHQKMVVVDGNLAFVGGTDLCENRWDDRSHLASNPERVDRNGKPYKPYHELMAYCTGAVVDAVEDVFRERWRHTTGAALALTRVPDAEQSAGALPSFAAAFALTCSHAAVARTFGAHQPSGREAVEEILHLYEDSIRGARQLIYLETQYFTSRAIVAAFVQRLSVSRLPPIQVVIVLPHGSDTPKENLALGHAQDRALQSIVDAADQHGQALRVLYSGPSEPSPDACPTFIHAKLLIADDRVLTIGSANCTNRSMSLDSELHLAWECEPSAALVGEIAQLRASLLSEHAGIAHDPTLAASSGLIGRIDELVRNRTRLKLRPVVSGSQDLGGPGVIERIFDPERPLTELELSDLLLTGKPHL